MRENGESIALLQGENEERNALDRSLRMVLSAWRDICLQTVRTTVVSQTSGYIAPILPIILCAPKFLDGSMTLGEVMQAASAFTIVQGAFNWLVDNYPRLAEWTASARRVASLQISLDQLERAENSGTGRINRRNASGSALRLRNLSVVLEDRTLIAGADIAIMPGEKVLLTGESGCGKSTLVRALVGVWPWGEGDIETRPGQKLFILPQRPYIPAGTLRRVASYPEPAHFRSVEEVTRALKKVKLAHHAQHLDEDRPWHQLLSAGEKQRLGFARILLHQPNLIVLDEATSALDSDSEDQLFQLLFQEFKLATVVSIAQRSELEAHHSRKIVLQRGRGGGKVANDDNIIRGRDSVRGGINPSLAAFNQFEAALQ